MLQDSYLINSLWPQVPKWTGRTGQSEGVAKVQADEFEKDKGLKDTKDTSDKRQQRYK